MRRLLQTLRSLPRQRRPPHPQTAAFPRLPCGVQGVTFARARHADHTDHTGGALGQVLHRFGLLGGQCA